MFQNMFAGQASIIVSAMLILLMLMLMLSMSIRLMLSRRKKAYFSLSFSLLLTAIQYVLIIILGSRTEGLFYGFDPFLNQGLKVLAFITTNMGIYQLYNTTQRKVKFVVFAGIAVAFVIIAARFYTQSIVPSDLSLATEEAGAFLNIWLDIYLFALIFYCFYYVTPTIGQTIKYQLALVIFFITHSAHMLNSYVYGGASSSLGFAEHFVPVLYFFILFQFIFERVLELMQAVYQSSITDGLTGLYNRRYFTKRIVQYVQANVPVSVIFCDIDNFKKLNDTQGHQRGDEVLRKVASIVMEESDEIGIPGRYGGEEIVMIILDGKIDPAQTAERIRARVEKEAGVTVSVGWSKYRKGVSGEQLIKQADEAMYVSKKTGKNRVSGFRIGDAAVPR